MRETPIDVILLSLAVIAVCLVLQMAVDKAKGWLTRHQLSVSTDTQVKDLNARIEANKAATAEATKKTKKLLKSGAERLRRQGRVSC